MNDQSDVDRPKPVDYAKVMRRMNWGYGLAVAAGVIVLALTVAGFVIAVRS